MLAPARARGEQLELAAAGTPTIAGVAGRARLAPDQPAEQEAPGGAGDEHVAVERAGEGREGPLWLESGISE